MQVAGSPARLLHNLCSDDPAFAAQVRVRQQRDRLLSTAEFSGILNQATMGIVLGITGGVATGKSTVTAMFAELGAETVSADDIAREVLAPDTPGADEVTKHFGRGILNDDGSINRSKLAALVFQNSADLETLNSITHPKIIAAVEDRIQVFRKTSGSGDILAAEIPLLFECGLESMVDEVVVTVAEQEAQINRLTTRGLTVDEANSRIAAQIPIAQKEARADQVIRTDTTLDDTRQQVKCVWEQLRNLHRKG